MPNENRTEISASSMEEEFEAVCIRCGACCGAYDGDPCEHLRPKADGSYFCVCYEKRAGVHHTIYGTEMDCVSIREVLHEQWVGDERCAYKKLDT